MHWPRAHGGAAAVSVVACGVNRAVGDSAHGLAGCLLWGDAALRRLARRSRWWLCRCFLLLVGRPNDGADVMVELDDDAVCIGLANVGVADGVLVRLGDGRRPRAGVGDRAR